MKQEFRWAFIGCGGIAESVAREFLQSDRYRIVALWNRTKPRAEEFSKRFGGEVYEDVEELLVDPEIDGVYIAVTANRHAEFMKRCIAHRKPVLCEKPFTVNAQEAQEVIEYVRQEGSLMYQKQCGHGITTLLSKKKMGYSRMIWKNSRS